MHEHWFGDSAPHTAPWARTLRTRQYGELRSCRPPSATRTERSWRCRAGCRPRQRSRRRAGLHRAGLHRGHLSRRLHRPHPVTREDQRRRPHRRRRRHLRHPPSAGRHRRGRCPAHACRWRGSRQAMNDKERHSTSPTRRPPTDAPDLRPQHTAPRGKCERPGFIRWRTVLPRWCRSFLMLVRIPSAAGVLTSCLSHRAHAPRVRGVVGSALVRAAAVVRAARTSRHEGRILPGTQCPDE